jgi:DNA primase
VIHRRAVVKALQRARIPFQSGGQRLVHIWCPFHQDRDTPSLVIYTNESPVGWYCFGCRAHGLWDDLAAAIKAGKLDRDWDDPRAARNLSDDLKNLISMEPALPPLTRPWRDGDYREFSVHTLMGIQTRWWYDEIDKVRRIVWPVWDPAGELVGWVGRDLDNLKDSERKYRNMPHMEAVTTLYPLPDLNNHYPERTVILVEGITDALRLLQMGLPAQAILGGVWSKARTWLLHVMGIERIVLAFDPDDAGDEARKTVGRELAKEFDEILEWEWPDGKDPGEADLETIEQLRCEAVHPKTPNDPHPWLLMAPKEVPPNWLPRAA